MKQNKINYYNTDDEIQFQKLDDFRKFNKNIKVNKSEKNQDVKYSNTDKNNFNGILKTNEDFDLLNEPNIKKELNYYNNSDFDGLIVGATGKSGCRVYNGPSGFSTTN